jgi:hypothetical protein
MVVTFELASILIPLSNLAIEKNNQIHYPNKTTKAAVGRTAACFYKICYFYLISKFLLRISGLIKIILNKYILPHSINCDEKICLGIKNLFSITTVKFFLCGGIELCWEIRRTECVLY